MVNGEGVPDTSPGHVVQGGASALETLDLVVEHDPAALIDELLSRLRGLEMRLHGGVIQAALGDALLDRLRLSIAEVGKRANSPFRLAVAGEFKRGKSTLVNALLEEMVAPVSPLPETRTFNSYSHGATFSVEMRLKGGGRVALKREHLAREALEPVIEAAPSEPLGLDVRLPVKKLEDLVLLDMPGLGDFGPDIRRQVQEHIASTDLLVVVVTALAPLSAAERTMLMQSIKPHDFPKLLFVVNMIDQVETEAEAERIRGYMEEQMREHFPGMRLYLLSSLDELRRVTNGTRLKSPVSERLARQFQSFRGDLDGLVDSQRTTIRADRMAASSALALADLEIRVRLLRTGLDKQSQEFGRELESLNSTDARFDQELAERRVALSQRVAALSQQAEDWMRAFGHRVGASLAEQLKDVSREDAERDMQFFLASRVESALASCLEAHVNEFVAVGGKLLGETASLEVGVPAEARAAASLAYTGAQWSLASTVRLVLNQTLGLGLAVDALGAVLSWTGARPTALEHFASTRLASPALSDAFAKAARAAYAATEKSLLKHLEQEYRARRVAMVEANRQASQLHHGSQNDLKTLSAGVEQALTLIGQTRRAVEELRSIAATPTSA